VSQGTYIYEEGMGCIYCSIQACIGITPLVDTKYEAVICLLVRKRQLYRRRTREKGEIEAKKGACRVMIMVMIPMVLQVVLVLCVLLPCPRFPETKVT
jgi:hypothetical protein